MWQSRAAGACLLLGVLSLPPSGWSQAANANRAPRVDMGTMPLLAGDTADIPIGLSAPDTAKIKSLDVSISFPKKLVTFTKADQGLAAEQSQAEIKTKTTDGGSDLSTLEVAFTAPGQLKSGILAYFKFKVSVDARQGVISLKLLDVKGTAEGGAQVQIAKGKDGEIGVYNTTEEMPVVGCFFFSH
jgi:hypothetical protein